MVETHSVDRSCIAATAIKTAESHAKVSGNTVTRDIRNRCARACDNIDQIAQTKDPIVFLTLGRSCLSWFSLVMKSKPRF
jgi:hypothetical protein